MAYCKRINEKWESTKQAVRDERETILDMSESTVLKSIKEGNTQDAKWLLIITCKDRGYGVMDGKRSGLTENQRGRRDERHIDMRRLKINQRTQRWLYHFPTEDR